MIIVIIIVRIIKRWRFSLHLGFSRSHDIFIDPHIAIAAFFYLLRVEQISKLVRVAFFLIVVIIAPLMMTLMTLKR